jgi:1-deoxy-D-xylulose-5-phosphate synthase
LPDIFIDHDKPEKMYDRAGLNAPAIVETALRALGLDQNLIQLPSDGGHQRGR